MSIVKLFSLLSAPTLAEYIVTNYLRYSSNNDI